jgi:hypothetical protein
LAEVAATLRRARLQVRPHSWRSCALQITAGSFLSRRMSLLNYTHRILLIAIALGGSVRMALAETDASTIELIASVSEQRMVIVRDGGWVKKYRISTSRFGTRRQLRQLQNADRTNAGLREAWGWFARRRGHQASSGHG